MNNFFPEIVITYLYHFRQAFSQPNFLYFQGFIIAFLLSGGRKCVTQMARFCFFIDKSLASWERFLANAQWDMMALSRQMMQLTQAELGSALIYACHYLVGIDTTFAAKVRGRMLGVQKWEQKSNNPDRGKSVVGHHWAIAGFLARMGDRWRCLPFLTRLISGQKQPSQLVVDADGCAKTASFWDTTVAMVRQIAHQISWLLCIVADAYFAKAPFINPLIEMGVSLVTRLRWDAVGWDDPHYGGRGRPPKKGRKWKLATLLDHLPHQQIVVSLYGERVTVTAVVKDLWLRDVCRRVRVVVIEAAGRPILLMSTSLSLCAKEIIEIYGARFSLETAIRELKQQMGFCDYQSTTTLAFLRFTQLCCCALSIARLLLSKWAEIPQVTETATGGEAETPFSLLALRRQLKGYVLKRLLFSNSVSDAELKKRRKELDAIVRIAA